MSETKTQTEGKQEFGALRSFFWPIYNFEVKKFLPMGLLMFFILFNYSALRSLKDAIVIPTGGSGTVPFLKGYVVFPAAILFVLLYSKMANIVSRQKLFYLTILPFLAYFAAFSVFLYPNQDLIHVSKDTIAQWQASYPNFQYVFPVIGNWSFSLFYVLSELWGSAMLSLLFWQFANEITKTNEAKRFYSMFGVIANLALMVLFVLPMIERNVLGPLASPHEKITFQLQLTTSLIMMSGVLIMALYWWMNKYVLTDPKFYNPVEASTGPRKTKPKLSIGESFKYILQSKYLGMIAMLVLCYGIVIGSVELAWKEQAVQYYPTQSEYKNFMDSYLFLTGLVTIIIMLTFKGVVAKYGWLRGAIMTPSIMLITSVLFFTFIFMKDAVNPMLGMVGTSSLAMAVLIGLIQNVLSKGTKYALFDPTKEMSYIPLDQESKVKGKAAVEVIGGRLGKGASGYISSTLLMITGGTTADIIPYISVVVVTLLIVWLVSVYKLNGLYLKKVAEHDTYVEKLHQKEVANDPVKKGKTAKASA